MPSPLPFRGFLLALASLGLSTQPLSAALIATYDAAVDADPVTSTGWFFWDGTGDILNQAVSDGGAPAWQIVDSQTGRYYYYGTHAGTALGTSGFRLSVLMRPTSSFGPGPNYNSYAQVTVGSGAGTSYAMVVGLDAGGQTQVRIPQQPYTYPDGVPNNGPLFDVAGGAADYHWYELIYAGPLDSLGVRLYIDGQLTATNLVGEGVAPSENRAYWGNGTVQGFGGANYRYVEFETGLNLSPIGVPEPAVLPGTALLGALALLARRRPRT